MLDVQNTQNKIYNDARRTYIDESDCKEGESICKKCKGSGQVDVKNYHHTYIETCPQCLGRGIVDWVTQAVERPPVAIGTDSSSSSSGARLTGIVKRPIPPKGRIVKEGMFIRNKVTKYKRRKIV